MKNLSFLPLTRLLLPLILWTLASTVQTRADDDIIPQALPRDRYTSLWQKSPFDLSAQAAQRTAGFAQSLALAGLVQIDGEYFAAVIDKNTQKRQLLSAKENEQGLKLSRSHPSDNLSEVSVTLQKGSEVAVLKYDLAYLQSSVAKTQSAPNPTQAKTGPASNGSGGNPSSPPPANRPPLLRKIPAKPQS